MTSDSTVVSLHQPEAIDDPLTAILRSGARRLLDFVAHYNATWLVARHGYRTPNQVRAEQRRLAQCPPANLPLAA